MKKSASAVVGCVGAMAVGILGGCSSSSGGQSSPPSSSTTSSANTATASTTASSSGLANTPAPKPLPSMTKITIIEQTKNEAWISPALAQRMGEFKKENLDVSIKYDAIPSDIVLALNHGQADVAFVGTNALLFNALAGNPSIKMVMDGGEPVPGSSGIFVKTSKLPGNATFNGCSLKGMKVGVGPALAGSFPSAAIGLYLQKNCPSVTLSDITLSPLFGTNALVAMKTGALDAGDLFAPNSAQAAGVAKIVTDLPSGGGGAIMGGLRTSKPDVAAAFVRALIRTQRTYLQGDYHKNPTVVSAISSILGIPTSVLTSAADTSLVFAPNGGFPTGSLTAVQNVYLSLKTKILTYKQPLSADAFYDNGPTIAALGNG